MPGFDEPLLINILGHTAGALLFAIFLFLLFSGRGWSGGRGRALSGLAAGLALVWNLGSLAVLVFPGMPPVLQSVVLAVSFSVLSLLPAVLLHLSLGGGGRSLVAAGYALSTAAVAMHFWEILGNRAALHQSALLLITIGFLILTTIAVISVIGRRGQARYSGARIAGSMCLALFAMSFVHFGSGHAGQIWSSELIVHHAGIPLALFVLLQDYRFVLLDAFIRFLANALLAAVLSAVAIEAAFRRPLVDRHAREPVPEALLLAGVALLLVVFAGLRHRVQEWLTRAVFRQGSLAGISARVKDGPDFPAEGQYVEWCGAAMADAVRTPDHCVVPGDWETGFRTAAAHLASGFPKEWNWAEAVVPVRYGEENSKLILLGRRRGGQRYLGEDLAALSDAAVILAQRIESFRRREMHRLVTQAELRALQSQINPHFLFNALNTLYGIIPREGAVARRMVLNLADIFRYFLQSDRALVPLAEEMQIVRAYLEVEQLRIGERLDVSIEVDESCLQVPIPVLTIQPLVENAIKHGVAKRPGKAYLRIEAACREGELRVQVENSGGGGGTADTGGAGVALQNVRRRLEICYGSSSEMQLSIEAERAIAALCIPLADHVPAR